MIRIRLIRNACLILSYGPHAVLVDPCLKPKGTLPPYTLLRKKPLLNPLVDIPEIAKSALETITCGLITHCRNGHWDHLDKDGIRLFRDKNVPVFCTKKDESFLRRKKISTAALTMNRWNTFPGGRIMPVTAVHGRGIAGLFMGKGAGYLIDIEGEKKIYISGDTVMTQTVQDVLTDFKPDIAVVNAGTAILDIGRPILMPLDEIMEFIDKAPGRVLAVHMDAFNHCLTSRAVLRVELKNKSCKDNVVILEDGEEYHE